MPFWKISVLLLEKIASWVKNIVLLQSGKAGGECMNWQIATWFSAKTCCFQSNVDSKLNSIFQKP